jgi:hypothetical protein
MSDYNMLVTHWNKQPPLNIMVAAYLGIEIEEKRPTWETESFEELLARWGSTPGFGTS